MNIQIDPHTLHRAAERGVSLEEIRTVLEHGIPMCAKRGRLAKVKVFSFNQTRNGVLYPEKRVEVNYLEEADRLITVTVYAFYGRWTP